MNIRKGRRKRRWRRQGRNGKRCGCGRGRQASAEWIPIEVNTFSTLRTPSTSALPSHARMHARIFVNNIRGNLIIFLLPRFNSERFFRFSSPRTVPPERSHPAFVARSVVRCGVFARGKVRLVGGCSPMGWEMKGRPFSIVCVRMYEHTWP